MPTVGVDDRPGAEFDPAHVPGGWSPSPFREFILKVHSRCDLACDYCYMYEMADRSVPAGSRSMRSATVRRVASRIGEHVAVHGLEHIRVVLHGGEPLLAGADFLASTARAIGAAAGPGVRVDVALQTNGLRLDAAALRVLRGVGIRIGVSIDGGPAANDRHRRRADGRSSYSEAARALAVLAGAPEAFAGILAVIDLDNDPVGTYEDLLAFHPPAIDLLLPVGNWTTPPPGRPDDASSPYGDWLAVVFDRWFDSDRYEVRIRLFEEIIALLFGQPGATELIGAAPATVVVVDTDGTLEQIDTLRSSFPGAIMTGLNVFANSFDDALGHPAVMVRQLGLHGLSEICTACPVRRVCGGGYYPHRYRAGNGFRNPSVYCSDLRRLIEHVASRVTSELTSLTR